MRGSSQPPASLELSWLTLNRCALWIWARSNLPPASRPTERPMPEALISRPIQELAPLLERKEISPLELYNEAMERIHQLQPKLNSFITITEEEGRKAATEAQDEIRRGQYRGPLHGIPISIKDLFATRGVRTTAGSKVLAHWVPDYDATAVARLRQAGMVLIGKAHMHEFAYGV